YFYSEVHKAEMQAKSDDRERNYALFIASVRLISTCLLKWNLTFHLSKISVAVKISPESGFL
ncbi:hypothetical protein, partial [Galactobacillus timonensis]|uniref:hypothetical protein n=1 Tax=Galactobacillus timonensis TaxID=2041840 RepID=UPI0023F4670C